MKLKFYNSNEALSKELLYKKAFKEACSLLVLNDVFKSQSSAEQCILRKFKPKKMEKLQVNQILVKDAKLAAVKLNETNVTVTNLINETKQKQVEALKLKDINCSELNKIIDI
ncbi:MAG: hypothetical protein JNL69_00695 [Bacteroidia bacterium]|nr:hypothetical protein [Bacteroidia bacterium]